MLDYSYSPQEHGEFRDSVRRFANDQLVDGYHVRAQQTAFPWDDYQKLADLGLFDLSTADGNDDFVAIGIACEELARADFNISFAYFTAVVMRGVLRRGLTPEVASEWTPDMARGRAFVALGLTAPESGSDAAAMRTRARRVPGGWRLTGEKSSISLATHARGAVIFAVTDPNAGARGISAFLVPLDASGVSTAAINDSGIKPIGRGVNGSHQ